MLEVLPIEEITVADRQRKTISEEQIEALAESIKVRGLLHPPIVTPDRHLIAGERRLRAIKMLNAPYRFADREIPALHVPVSIKTADLLERKETELAENLLREDLSWKERVAAIAELHKLRQAADPTHTKSDTTRELQTLAPGGGYTHKAVTVATVVEPFLEDPEVRSASSVSEAYKIATRKLEADFIKRAPRLTRPFTLIHAEFPNVQLEDRFDCIIADPPYGIGAETFRGAAHFRHRYADQDIELAKIILRVGYDLCKEKAHCYLFCDVNYFRELREVGEEAGWRVAGAPIIWNKGNSGIAPDFEYFFKRSYECILFASKNKKPLSGIFNDVISIASGRKEFHAAEKPLELISTLIARSCLPGESILDPCCGSGTTGLAAAAHQCHATLIEADRETHDTALVRLENYLASL